MTYVHHVMSGVCSNGSHAQFQFALQDFKQADRLADVFTCHCYSVMGLTP